MKLIHNIFTFAFLTSINSMLYSVTVKASFERLYFYLVIKNNETLHYFLGGDFILRSAYERETIITYNEAEDEAHVYTFNKALIRKLTDISQERPDECILESKGPEDAASFVVPKKYIKVKPPVKMNLTNEQKRERAERMRRIQKQSSVNEG